MRKNGRGSIRDRDNDRYRVWGPPSPPSPLSTGAVSLGVASRRVKLNTCLHVVPKLHRKGGGGGMPPLHNMSSWLGA
jgi:hypothetical protein